MTTLSDIHELLIEEYAASRHIWWQDEMFDKWVNDVVYALLLMQQTAECLQRGDENCWQVLVTYCLERAMSYRLIVAMGEYLSNCITLTPLPLIDLNSDTSAHVRASEFPLSGEVERIFHIHSSTAKPEPDRLIAFKHEQSWSRYSPRLRDEHPVPLAVGATHKSVHWLF